MRNLNFWAMEQYGAVLLLRVSVRYGAWLLWPGAWGRGLWRGESGGVVQYWAYRRRDWRFGACLLIVQNFSESQRKPRWKLQQLRGLGAAERQRGPSKVQLPTSHQSKRVPVRAPIQHRLFVLQKGGVPTKLQQCERSAAIVPRPLGQQGIVKELIEALYCVVIY